MPCTPTAAINSLSNSSTVKGAIQQAINNIDPLFANPVTLNINFSWGNVNGQALPSNALGTSSTSLYGYYNYGNVVSMLKNSGTTSADQSAYSSLPSAAPAGQSRYVITSAQAKALGVVAPTGSALDGTIGFGSGAAYSFNPKTVASGTYDFVGVVEHEMTEVMGRISGLANASPSYATLEDLFRFSAPGTRNWNYGASSYFSINNGATDLADFNHSSSGGDRADWLSTGSTNDVADAFTYSGTPGVLSSLDQQVLDVIGWGSTGVGSGGASSVVSIVGADTAMPEPASLSVLGLGLAAFAGLRRRR